MREKSSSPLVCVSRRSPCELNHWMLGTGFPVTLQSISAQLPSRAIIWLTSVNTTGTNPSCVALLLSVSLPTTSTDKAPAEWEAARETRTRKTNPPVRCIFTSCWRVAQRRRDRVVALGRSILHAGYLLIVEGSLVDGCVCGSTSLQQQGEQRQSSVKQHVRTNLQVQILWSRALWTVDELTANVAKTKMAFHALQQLAVAYPVQPVGGDVWQENHISDRIHGAMQYWW